MIVSLDFRCKVSNLLIFCVPTGVFSLTVFIPPEINVILKSDSSIVLNCTYILDVNESIDVLFIKKKTSSGSYIELAKFTDRSTLYIEHGEYLRERSKIYGFKNGSSSVVLAINDVRCEDDGQYQCFVYYNTKDTALKNLQNTTVYINGNILIHIQTLSTLNFLNLKVFFLVIFI